MSEPSQGERTEGQPTEGEPARVAPPPAAPAAPPAPAAPAPVQVRLRRAPRYRSFVLLGAVLGAVAGIVAAVSLGDPQSFIPSGTITGYLAAIGLLLGGLLGATVAVLVERRRD